MSTSASNLAVHTIAGARVIEFSRADMTDAALIKAVGDEIYHLTKGADRPKLVIDFRKVERLSSATVGLLIALDKVVTKQRGQLRVANVSAGVSDLFALTRLDQALTICNSTQDAVESFNQVLSDGVPCFGAVRLWWTAKACDVSQTWTACFAAPDGADQSMAPADRRQADPSGRT